MAIISLNDEQSRRLRKASLPIRIVDSQGNTIAEFGAEKSAAKNTANMTEEEWTAEAIRRSDDARLHGGIAYTTKEVLKHLEELSSDQPSAP